MTKIIFNIEFELDNKIKDIDYEILDEDTIIYYLMINHLLI